MRVLDVRAVLDRERDIQLAGPKTKVLESFNFKNTKYAILSHRWEMEVDYDEMSGLMKMDDQGRDEIRRRKGYRKIINSCERALKDGYAWLWVDTCCIDKRSSAELSEAINSMYRWYRNVQRCYVYLSDVDGLAFPAEQDFSRFDRFHGWPEWFSRGWTLQELIAPREVEFFNKSWMSIGTKQDLTSTLQIITRIPEKVLRDGQVLRSTDSSERPGVAHIMSWAADRKTRRAEDRAYSLMGLFGVNMPMLYGEGSKAFQRLQLEIIRASSDRSIFAWNPKGCLGNYGSVLAEDPNCFRGCHDIENIVDHNEFADELKEYIRENGLDVDTHHGQGKLLSLRSGAASIQLSIFNVTNVGIQVWLPIIPDRDDSKSVFKAVLPCLDCDGNLITIDLESCGLSSSRCLGASRIRNTWPEFTSLYLAYAQDAEESYHDLRLNDRRASWNGFTRCGAFPCEILRTCNTVILSPEKSLIVLVYANNEAKSRFAVGLGYCLGEVWARVVCDECPKDQQAQSSWADFAKQAYDFLWNAPVDESYFCGAFTTIKATHLPKSIWDARIVCGSNGNGYTDVIIDIEQCPGCCTGPCIRRSLDDEILATCIYAELLHELQLDGQSTWLQECSGQGIALGDYGHYSTHDGFNRHGNVFEYMQELGIDPIDSVYGPVVSRVSSCEHVLRCHDIAMTSSRGENLALCRPNGFSLPNNEQFNTLLKAFSTRFAGKHLVTTVIQCSEFYKVGREGRQDLRGESACKGSDGSADPGIFIPLCIVATPLAWHREPASEQRREQFENIRKHFYALANPVPASISQAHHLQHRLSGIEARRKPVDRRVNDAIDFLVIFGLEHLKKFVGKLTFFERLPSTMQSQRRGEAHGGTATGNGLLEHPSNPSFNPRCEIAVPALLEKCDALGRWSPTEKRKTQREVESISQTLSVELLEHIGTILLDASEGKPRTSQVCHSDYDTVHSTVREVDALQAKLQAAEDEDEQRALEEDITGKILWFYWRGICSEVDQLLSTAMNYIRRGSDSKMISEGHVRSGLREIAGIVKGTRRMNLDGNVTHLQRIMDDAGAGISRHELWLAARATERARLSRVLGGRVILGIQEAAGPEAPCTPTVQKMQEDMLISSDHQPSLMLG